MLFLSIPVLLQFPCRTGDPRALLPNINLSARTCAHLLLLGLSLVLIHLITGFRIISERSTGLYTGKDLLVEMIKCLKWILYFGGGRVVDERETNFELSSWIPTCDEFEDTRGIRNNQTPHALAAGVGFPLATPLRHRTYLDAGDGCCGSRGAGQCSHLQ